MLVGTSARYRELRQSIQETGNASNAHARRIGLIERDDLAQLSLEAAADQHKAWLAEARLLGAEPYHIAILDRLFFEFVGLRGTMRNMEGNTLTRSRRWRKQCRPGLERNRALPSPRYRK
ncbi:MAG: hypothetical protein JWP36_115 [Paucimonas sp.]|nr:hypothetical protein [Paucimonas sp.]